MTPPSDNSFNYLAVLFSIILGLALTEILQGFRRLLLARRRVELYAPPIIWALTLLLVLAQTWWAMFALRSHSQWTFAMYGVVLLQCIVVYMTCALALPDDPDMRAGYDAHARPFFMLLFAAVAVSLARDAVMDGGLRWSANLLFQMAFAGSAGIAALTRNRWYHQLLAPTAGLLFVAYVALLFGRL